MDPTLARLLPEDCGRATLIGRVWLPEVRGPAVVAVRGERVIDISDQYPTSSDLLDCTDPATAAQYAEGQDLGAVTELLERSLRVRGDLTQVHLLSPNDLQAVKASGVTFIASLLERVVEEQARGNPAAADEIRQSLVDAIGADLSQVRPGSPLATSLKAELQRRGYWSQYLEVGIGPDAEVFTKCLPMASVGFGADIGILPSSSWNNPEPEIVLCVSSRGHIVGATLGNDVNLRDIEGRSALLLGRAKDNNASCAIGPFIRLFDRHFDLDTVRHLELHMTVRGSDGYELQGHSSMREISRDPAELVRQTINEHHAYPDGLVLFLGTMFAPKEDRFAAGQGFSHAIGDEVDIHTPTLGVLTNQVVYTNKAPRWQFGVRALMRNLQGRGLL